MSTSINEEQPFNSTGSNNSSANLPSMSKNNYMTTYENFLQWKKCCGPGVECILLDKTADIQTTPRIVFKRKNLCLWFLLCLLFSSPSFIASKNILQISNINMLSCPASFHESYFEHLCTVVTEKDVLYTDIRGDGSCVKAKRWFYSWILLSYDDERCRIYYVSSQALRLERARHYRQYRGRIHPLSKFSTIWTLIYFIILTFNRMLFHINTAMVYGNQSAYSLIVGAILEVVALIDLIINFKTGYTDEVSRKVYLDATMGYAHYASTKLFIHFAAAMPLQLIMMIRYGIKHCLFCRANLFICTLKLLSIFGLLRLYDGTRFLDQQRSSFSKMHLCKCLRIVVLALLTMLYVIDFIDTVNIVIMLQSQIIYKKSYLSMVMRAKLILYKVPDIFFMCIEFSTLCKSVMLFGYGLYRHDYYLDKIFSLLCHITGCVFLMWGAVECYAIIQRQKFVNDEIWMRRDKTKAWMRSSQLSDMINTKITDYYESHLSSAKYTERHNDLYRSLPTILIKEIKLSAYFNLIQRIPYFAEWPVDVIEEVTLLFREEMYLERDLVAHPFTQGEGLYVVFAGVLAVYNVARKEAGHLIDGDYFGELSLVTDKELRTSTVTAVTVCQVLTLHKRVFRNMMRKYTTLFFQLRKVLLQKYEMNHGSLMEFPEFA